MKKIIYKDIPGMEGRYKAGSNGSIYSLITNKHLKPSAHINTGYLLVNLTVSYKRQKVFYVHRLVASAFLGKPKGKIEVNHKNGDRADNRIKNLEYVTRTQNQRHSWQVLNRKPSVNRGEAAGNAKLTDKKVLRMRQLYATGRYTYKEIGERFGISGGHASKVINGDAWSHI